MNLELVAEKLAGVAKKIKVAKGPLELFGLFLRENSWDLWDIVIAAHQLKEDERASYEYVASLLSEVMTDQEMTGFSRIVILEEDGVVLKSFLEQFGNSTGLVDVHFVLITGPVIRRAYIIVANPATARTHRQNTKKPRRSKAGAQEKPQSSQEGQQ